MPSRFRSVIKIATLLACGFAGTASGQTAQNISSFTSTAEKDCRKLNGGSADDDGGTRVCPGPAGLVVLISEGDLRETVSAGRNAKAASNEPAAQARFGPFSSTTPIIEWRRTARDQPPFAMIQRWHLADIADEDKDGRPRTKQVLVVTRLVPGGVCHVAYVDVTANPNPNDLAREAADTLARGFTCGTDKVKAVGTSGRAMELARPG